MRKAVKRFVLGKPKLRQSWNKYNLYNIYQYKSRIDYVHRTFFQQKWAAKSATRAYHGEHVGEKRWTRDFSRRLRSVVDMPVPYLARFDGSEQAEGRGSGKQGLTVTSHSYAPRSKGNKGEDAEGESGPWNALHPPSRSVKTWVFRKFYDKMTPYMQMTYAPMERRLEVAMHRALFASSPRQARQFCIHGAVKVNGKKMKYGSYMLNPGDLFEVDPDKVMFAAGKDKNTVEFEARARLNAEIEKLKTQAIEEGRQFDESSVEAEAKAAASEDSEEALPDLEELPEEDRVKEQRKRIFGLIRSAKEIITSDPRLTAKRKQELRSFMKKCKAVLKTESKKKDTDKLSPHELVKELASSLSKYQIDSTSEKVVAKESPEDPSTTVTEEGEDQQPTALSTEETSLLANLLRKQEMEDSENPVDPTKPYATPWAPRKWLRPFAFIPRYLEVNQNICAAVYLRHPVARKGLAEVPTPFPYDVGQLAYAWYLRRR